MIAVFARPWDAAVGRTMVVGLALVCPFLAPLIVHDHEAVTAWLEGHASWLGALLGSLPPVFPQSMLIAAAIVVVLLVLSAVLLHRVGARTAHGSAAIPGISTCGTGLVDRLPAIRSSVKTWELVACSLACSWLALVSVMCLVRVRDPSSGLVTLAWFGSFVLAWLVALLVDGRFSVAGGPAGVSRRSAILLAALVVVMTMWMAGDLDSWRYSCIGDEWGVYERASSYAREDLLAADHYLGSVSKGIYRVHAPILSGTQSLVMRVAGIDNFGWRLSAVLAASLSLVPFVLFAGRLLGRAGLVVAVVLVVSSPVLFAEAHTGYGWGQMRLWTMCVLAALVNTIDRGRLRYAVLLGIFCALCSLISGLAVFVAPLALLCLLVGVVRAGGLSRSHRLRLSGRRWMALLFIVAVVIYVVGALLPGWLSAESESLMDRLRNTLWKTNVGPLAAHFLGPEWFDPPLKHVYGPAEFAGTFGLMLVRSVLAPLTFTKGSHYVVGHIVDPIGAGLFIVGMVVSLLSRIGRRRTVLLWLFYIPTMLLAGAFAPYHEYGDLRITRLHILVPFWAIFAGLGFEAVARVFRLSFATRSRWLAKAGFGLVVGAILLWNLHSIHVRIPQSEEQSSIVLAVKEMQYASPDQTLLACLGPWHPIEGLLGAYPDNERLQVVDDERFAELVESREFDENLVFLFQVGTNTPAQRELCVGFLTSYTEQLQCTVLPSAVRPRILKCRTTAAPSAGLDGLWSDGVSNIRYCD